MSGPTPRQPPAPARLVSRRHACRTLLTLVGLAACGRRGRVSEPAVIVADPFLLQHNARFNDGRTIRWADLPIPVFTDGIARPDEITAWTAATNAAVSFALVAEPPARGIRVRFGGSGRGDICGLTTVEFLDDGRILSAEIQVVSAIFRSSICVRTVTHEIGHALGFLDHATDGGLMEPDGGNGRFTGPVTDMMRRLYALPPGTGVTAAEGSTTVAPALRRRGPHRILTIGGCVAR